MQAESLCGVEREKFLSLDLEKRRWGREFLRSAKPRLISPALFLPLHG